MTTFVISVLPEGTPVDKMSHDDDGSMCPMATRDPEVNAENKEVAIEEADYRDSSMDGGFVLSEVCGNCGAYDQTEEILECIGDESGETGYCQNYRFVCSSDHTCEDWVTGGPITAPVEGSEHDIL
jgi:hypothetical protein